MSSSSNASELMKLFPFFTMDHCRDQKQVDKAFLNLFIISDSINLKKGSEKLINLIDEKCRASLSYNKVLQEIKNYVNNKRKENYQSMMKLDYKKRSQCDMNFLAVTDALRYAKEKLVTDKSMAQSIKSLQKKYKKEIQIMKDESETCPYSLNDQAMCSKDANINLARIIFKSKNRSVKREVIKAAESIYEDCSARDLKPLREAFTKLYQKVTLKSLAKEFDYQLYRYNYSFGVDNSIEMYKNLERIVSELNDPVRLDAFYTLRPPPSKEQYQTYIQNRRASCFDIDLTNYHNKPEGKQGASGTCYAFGGAGILNNALGVDNINPLYLYLLSFSEKLFPNHIPVIDDIMDSWSESSFSMRGGFSRSVAKAALAYKNYCTKDDLYNPWKTKEDMGIMLLKSDILFKIFTRVPRTEKYRKGFFNKHSDYFKKMFPKMSLKEFLKLTKNYHGSSAGLYRKLVFSQCKTPLPKIKNNVEVHQSFVFDAEKIDSLLNEGRIITFNHNAERLFQDDHIEAWPNHVVLMTGRRWNPHKSRCEYRIVNSYGDQCNSLTKTEDATCNKEEGMWISEGLARHSHFNHEYTAGPRDLSTPYHPAMDPDAVE